jgi:PKD repeat protein
MSWEHALLNPLYRNRGGVPEPVADFSVDDTAPNNIQVVQFADLSENATEWLWNFGDGTSTEQNPTHTYTAAGTYTVSLTVTNAAGEDTATKVDYITVSEATFAERMLALPGLIAYWPLAETTGTVADNAEGSATRDGTYKNAPTLAGTPFPVGDNVVSLDGSNDCVDIYGIAPAFNGTEGWAIVWFLDPAPGTPVNDYLLYLFTDGNNQVFLAKDATTGSQYKLFYRAGGGTTKTTQLYSSSTNWHMMALSWSQSNNQVLWWMDGVLASTLTASGTWAGALAAANAVIMAASNTGGLAFAGSAGHCAIGAGQLLTSTLVEQVYRSVVPNVSEIAFAGDSKMGGGIWADLLVGLTTNATGNFWRTNPRPFASSGWTAALLHTYLDANIGAASGNPSIACINIGVNNAALALPPEADWKADLVGIVDAFRGKWPTIDVYISKIWDRRDPVDCATLNTWIDDVIATQAYIHAGPDESVWLENGDDGITYTSDGTHYNAAGQVEAANQWKAALGY